MIKNENAAIRRALFAAFRSRYCIKLYATLLISFAYLNAQSISDNYQEAGRPFIQNFSQKEYLGHTQNWAVLQDKRGIMYFGNGSGILEYDGNSWRLFAVSNRTTVRSLAMDKNGRVYVGAKGEFGYLAPDSSGTLHYISMRSQIDSTHQEFGDVWQILNTNDGLFFRTSQILFHWSYNGKMTYYKPQTFFHRAYQIHDRFFILQPGIGLMELVSDSMVVVPGGQRFADDRIYAMLPYSKSPSTGLPRTLIASRGKGLILYENSQFKPFDGDPDVAEFVKNCELYHGSVLPDGTLALSTGLSGIILLSQNGALLQIINKAAGLLDNNVNNSYSDNQNGLWVALNNGLSRIEVPSPVSAFGENSGLESTVEAIIKHDGHLYVSTHTGVFMLPLPVQHLNPLNFQPVRGLTDMTWSLLTVDDRLLGAAGNGVYYIEADKASRICELYAFSLFHSQYHPDRLYVGLGDGLALLLRKNGNWQLAGRVAGVVAEVRSFVEEMPGTLWLGTLDKGFIHVTIDGTDFQAQSSKGQIIKAAEFAATVQYFGPEKGVPAGGVDVYKINEEILFATNKGLKRFDPATQTFLPNSIFGDEFADSTSAIFHVTAVADDRLLLTTNFGFRSSTGQGWGTGILTKNENNAYTWDNSPFLRISNYPSFSIYPDPSDANIIWFGTGEGVFRNHVSRKMVPARDYSAMVRRVISNGDFIIYGGYKRDEAETHPDDVIPSLKYSQNAIRFEYSAASYDVSEENRYQFMLDGFEDSWSDWTAEVQKDYTNLPEGDYIFRIRAKNIYRHLGTEDTFAFSILPPWYRSWWMYLLYAVLTTGSIALLVFGYNQRRTRHLQQRTKELEDTVKDRTIEIVAKNLKLAEQAEQLQALDGIKSRFFANISHEFRTPLTLILGPINRMEEKLKKSEFAGDLSIVQRNARRLLGLINELLDLAKLESGKMTLQATPGNIIEFLKGLLSTFSSLAEIRNIEIEFKAPIENENSESMPTAYFDHDKLEKVFANILANAFKFTPDGGKIAIRVDLKPPSTDDQPRPHIEIRISDTGTGIPAADLPFIFDRFYQARDESGTATDRIGTGIGMALTKELIDLHQGSITVESKLQHGTTFIILLPSGYQHLKPEQIVTHAPGSDAKAVKIPPSSTADKPSMAINDVKHLPGETQISAKENDAEVILIVEDNPDMRTYIRNELQESYQLLEAENGRAGFETALENIPDLIISDVMMPEMNGYQLCEKLKTDERTSHIPVILLTAKAGEESKIEGLETGADDYLTKPFSLRELQVRVKNLIEQRKNLRKRFSGKINLKPEEVSVTSIDQKFLEKVVRIIETHISDEQFSVEDLAKEVGMSDKQLYRKLRALTGHSINHHILSIRLQRAAELLRKNAGTISDIAYQTGFNTPNYFTKVFRKHFGKTPKQYRDDEPSA